MKRKIQVGIETQSCASPGDVFKDAEDQLKTIFSAIFFGFTVCVPAIGGAYFIDSRTFANYFISE